MENDLQKRKKNRLENYDYSSWGAYFITICTLERRNYFWHNVGATIGRPQITIDDIIDETTGFLKDMELSPYGKIVDEAINNIPRVYPAISLEKYVIMPDHIHLLLMIRVDERGRPMVAPTLSRVIQQMKGYVTKRIGISIWQKLFFDHIIRNMQDYEEHVKYIYENPIRWYYDKLYPQKTEDIFIV